LGSCGSHRLEFNRRYGDQEHVIVSERPASLKFSSPGLLPDRRLQADGAGAIMNGRMSHDATYIRRAIALARQARERGNHPFGALLVADDHIVLEAENTVVTENNPTHHAEMNLVQGAWRQLPAELITRSTLYTSTEPCPMCTGAIFWSGIRRVVFSFPALDLGELAHDRFCGPCNVLFDRAEQRTEIIGPILADEGRQVHVGFWTTA
jgi:tRNA(Arg) A34 adenosine deaminase TadA